MNSPEGQFSITQIAAGFPENGLLVNASTIYCFTDMLLYKLEIINRESFFVISVNLSINYWKKRDSYDTASN